MNNFFKNDIVVRVISVVCALFLWIYVVNLQNPNERQTIRNIKVKKINTSSLAEKGLKIVNEKELTVNVSVEGKTQNVTSLNTSDFDVEIDYSNITAPGKILVGIEQPKCSREGVEITGYSPTAVTFEVERIEQKLYTVDIEIIGDPRPGFAILKKEIKPNTLSLKEIESLINQVGSIKVTVDINNIDRSRTYKKECKAYNKKGEEMTELQKQLPAVDVEIFVGRIVPVEITVMGTPKAGFYLSSSAPIPESIMITGDDITTVNKIVLEPFSIEGKSESEIITPELKLPAGVRLANLVDKLSVQVDIKPNDTRTITVKDVVFEGNKVGFEYKLLDEGIEFVISASPYQLNSLSSSDIIVSADVSKLGLGEHDIPIEVLIPPSIKITQASSTIKILVKEKIIEGT